MRKLIDGMECHPPRARPIQRDRPAMKVVAAKLGVGRSHNTVGNPSIT